MGVDGEELLDELLPEVSGFCKYIQGYVDEKVNKINVIFQNKFFFGLSF